MTPSVATSGSAFASSTCGASSASSASNRDGSRINAAIFSMSVWVASFDCAASVAALAAGLIGVSRELIVALRRALRQPVQMHDAKAAIARKDARLVECGQRAHHNRRCAFAVAQRPVTSMPLHVSRRSKAAQSLPSGSKPGRPASSSTLRPIRRAGSTPSAALPVRSNVENRRSASVFQRKRTAPAGRGASLPVRRFGGVGAGGGFRLGRVRRLPVPARLTPGRGGLGLQQRRAHAYRGGDEQAGLALKAPALKGDRFGHAADIEAQALKPRRPGGRFAARSARRRAPGSAFEKRRFDRVCRSGAPKRASACALAWTTRAPAPSATKIGPFARPQTPDRPAPQRRSCDRSWRAS